MVTTHPVSPPDGRTGRRRLVLVGLAIILVFAVIGVVSAGIFVGSALSSGARTPAKGTHPTAVPGSLQDIHRAQAQATRIVAQARKSGRTASRRVTAHARAQATALVAAAKRRSGAIAAAVPTAAPVQPTNPSIVSPTSPATSGTGAPASGATGTGGTSGAPDLSGAPASWKVVAYGATFGSGAGVGSVTVLNRSSGSFSGTVKIAYTKGGAAYASFSGLTPGQSEVLTLSGTPYPGGGYTILLPSVR